MTQRPNRIDVWIGFNNIAPIDSWANGSGARWLNQLDGGDGRRQLTLAMEVVGSCERQREIESEDLEREIGMAIEEGRQRGWGKGEGFEGYRGSL